MANGDTVASNVPEQSAEQLSSTKLTRDESPIVSPDGLVSAIRQGEIISNVTQFEYRRDEKGVVAFSHRYVIVASQDCDLDWDFKNRGTGDAPPHGKLLRHVFLYEALEAPDVAPFLPPGTKSRQRIRDNKDERYAFIELVPANLDLGERGLPELIVDFKRYFTIPTDELYLQINDEAANSAQRRCCLVSPYREHFQARACQFQSRVALPLDHESQKQ